MQQYKTYRRQTRSMMSIARINVPTATVAIMNGKPALNHRLKLIEWPFFSLIPAAIIPALDPISVPLPPKFAPNDSAHQSGLISKLPQKDAMFGWALSVLISGIIVAVNGMLSTNALAMADSHIMLANVSHG